MNILKESLVKIMKYRLFIDCYDPILNNYSIREEVIEVKDKNELYQQIGYIYCNSITKIIDIRYKQELPKPTTFTLDYRTPEYMDYFINEIREIWGKFPELRFCQLIENVKPKYRDLFYINDNDLLSYLKDFSKKENKND